MMAKDRIRADDEIDLVALAFSLWEGKWMIAAVTVLGIAIGGLFGFIQPITASLEIRPLPSSKMTPYLEQNRLSLFSITSERLYALLIDELHAGGPWIAALRSAGHLAPDELVAEDNFVALRDVFKRIRLIQKDDHRWQIQVEAADVEEALGILQKGLAEADLAVRAVLTDDFRRFVDDAITEKSEKIEDLQLRIDSLLDDYEIWSLSRLAFLEEQLAIARQLGIARNPIYEQRFAEAGGNVNILGDGLPFYLWGYEAIEKEIDLIKERSNTRPFLTGLLELEQELRMVKSDQLIARVQNAFSRTPAATGIAFETASFTIANTLIQSRSILMLLAVGALLGGLIGTVSVLLRNALRK
jgi:LPS O-antigen subunit length determinant protein (WzzB/FepE family)